MLELGERQFRYPPAAISSLVHSKVVDDHRHAIDSEVDVEFDAIGARAVSIEFVEMIDLFLLGTIPMITSLGLYQLFIDDNMDLPEWAIVTNLEQLKFNLLAVIVVMLAVLFVAEAAGGLGESDSMLDYGLAIGVVVAAIALAVWVFQRVSSATEKEIREAVEAAHHKYLQQQTEDGEE